MGGTKFFVLTYADDIAILAATAAELQQMFRSLEKYIKTVRMEVNIEKTKIMIFQNGGRRQKGKSGNLMEKKLRK